MNSINQSRKIEPSNQELHTQEVKDFLLYAAQEGGQNDVKTFYEGFDVDKLVDFIRKENGNLETYPPVIAIMFLKDERLSIRQALQKYSSLYSHTNFFSLKEWEELHDLTPESVVENGRRCALTLLKKVKEEDKELNAQEISAVENMALNIPDEEVLGVIQELSVQNHRLAIELIFNPAVSTERLESIVEMALKEAKENLKWNNVLLEIIANHFDRLGDEIVAKLEKAPDPIPSYIGFFKKALDSSNIKKSEKKERVKKNSKSKIKQRRKKKAEVHREKLEHWETIKGIHEAQGSQETYF